MQSRAEAIAEVKNYIANRIRDDVDADLLAADIVDNDDGQGHGEVRGYYTLNGNPLVVSFEPASTEAA